MTEQGTREWHLERLGKVTASRMSDVMMKHTTAGWQNYRAQLICERLTGEPTETFTSPAMQHGTETEPQARAFYELAKGCDVEQVGFVTHPDIQMAGASPDGLVGDNGLIEIKCPQPAKHIAHLSGAAIDRKYVLQMQWQMACTGREWCDFVSFSPAMPPELHLSDERVLFDAELAAEMVNATNALLADVDAAIEQLTKRMEAA